MSLSDLVTGGTIGRGRAASRSDGGDTGAASPRRARCRDTLFFPRLVLAGALTGAVLGCAAPQPDVTLLQARADYAAAANDPGAASQAPDQLRQSQEALQQAEQTLSSGGDMTLVDHYAFLASRYAATAQQTARLKEAQQTVANAPAERRQAAEAARTQRAEQQAIAAQQQAQTAQQQAAAEHQRAEQAQAGEQHLQKELARLEARQTAQGLVLSPREILFKPGSAVLQPGAEPAIRRIADFLKSNPDRSVLVRGFTDSMGSATVNQQLSEQRADAVRLALANDGVDASRIRIRGMSDAQPLASNDTAAGRLVNRRVQLVISNPQEIPASGSTQQH
jgi:outer membrane protein OmpA-like peptidoglycan-associated protein